MVTRSSAGTREVYEERLRNAAIYDYDPTIARGLGSARCPRCLSLLDSKSENRLLAPFHNTLAIVLFSKEKNKIEQVGSEDPVDSVLHLGFKTLFAFYDHTFRIFAPVYHYFLILEAGAGIGSIGGTVLSADGVNTGIPFLQNHVKGLKWLPLTSGLPRHLLFAAAGASFAAYAVPNFAQLLVTSYNVSFSASHYVISLLTRRIEDTHISRAQKRDQDDTFQAKT